MMLLLLLLLLLFFLLSFWLSFIFFVVFVLVLVVALATNRWCFLNDSKVTHLAQIDFEAVTMKSPLKRQTYFRKKHHTGRRS